MTCLSLVDNEITDKGCAELGTQFPRELSTALRLQVRRRRLPLWPQFRMTSHNLTTRGQDEPTLFYTVVNCEEHTYTHTHFQPLELIEWVCVRVCVLEVEGYADFSTLLWPVCVCVSVYFFT